MSTDEKGLSFSRQSVGTLGFLQWIDRNIHEFHSFPSIPFISIYLDVVLLSYNLVVSS